MIRAIFSCRMLPYVFNLIFYGLGLCVLTLPPAVAVAKTLQWRELASSPFSDGDASIGFIRGLRSVPPSSGNLLIEDQRALKSWANLLDNSTFNSNLRMAWDDNASTPCDWFGVKCGSWDAETRVTELDLSHQNLTGPMPSGLGKLTGLHILVVACNNFSESIPADIGNCSNLEVLNISSNVFSGNLPQEIFSECQNLKFLDASSNKLQGQVPDQLWSCTNIQEIYLTNNNFSGDLVFGTGRKRPLLSKLNLHSNKLSGNLPDVLSSIGCSNLTYIDLSINKFRGFIPPSLGKCSKLYYINFQRNNLTGNIPEDLGKLQYLQCLGLGKNGITGTIPGSLLRCPGLWAIDVSRNKLSGGIPSWLGKMPQLRFFTAHSNNISGQIPLELTQAPKLCHFDVGFNNLSGMILPELANLATLRLLRLANNHFTGAVPPALGNLTGLQGLDLSCNNLSGPIPSSFGSLQKLLWLQLAENHLTGSIPPEITRCRSLLWLNLRNNQFSGEIPGDFFSVGMHPDKAFLTTQEVNDLPPMNFGECSLAQSWIPGDVIPFDSMSKQLKLDQCRAQWIQVLTGQRVPLAYWQLSNNQFTGPIPVPFSKMSKLSCMLLSNNTLSGSIPQNLSEISLYNIDLAENSISGSIPDIFDKLNRTLQSLNLSQNNLSGTLPSTLNKLSFLSTYNFSYNAGLEGPVPNKSSFQNFEPDAYIGDPKLCRVRDATQIRTINQTMVFCPDSVPAQAPVPDISVKQSGFTKHLKLVSALIGFFGVLLLLLSVGSLFVLVWKFKKHQLLGKKQVAAFMDINSDCRLYDALPVNFHVPVKSFGFLKALTYSDLVLATDNFSPANIIGDGGFGIVYKAKLADGTAVAIKKLVQDGAQGDREFQAEMETLGLIKHNNLVPLLGYCCRSRERLLVYKCLSNGSLDDWLYDSEERAATLTWPIRLQIAAGTAQGLCFLHHECEPLIIHRDMKSSNILLDENFDACLTDFGLARLMDLQMTHVSTIVAGTPGYVPPEYGETWRATAKGDVYSFGVVMLELASGKRPIGPEFQGLEVGNLVAWVKTLTKDKRHTEVYDPIVVRTGDTESLWHFLTLAVLCTSTEVRLRPTMLQVSAKLEELKKRKMSNTMPQNEAIISDTKNGSQDAGINV